MQRTVGGCLMLTLGLIGCGGEIPEAPKIETPKVVEQAQQKVTNAVETVKQTVQVAGKIEMTVGAPLQTGGAYAQLITMQGRDTILQITSYNDPSNEQFPSVFLRAKVGGTTPAELANQQIHAELFVQQQPNGPVLATLPGRPVMVKINQVEGNVVSGEFMAGGMLVHSQSQAEVPVSGKFTSTLSQ